MHAQGGGGVGVGGCMVLPDKFGEASTGAITGVGLSEWFPEGAGVPFNSECSFS